MKAVTNGVSGDVYYLTDQEEVYDVVNTKLALPNTGCFKVANGVWVVLNREKTLNYRLNKPNEHVQANKYTKGTLINYGGDLYIANADIAENTAFAAGTSGSTWKKVTPGNSVAGWYGDPNPGSVSDDAGGLITLTQIDQYKAPFNGRITKVKINVVTSPGTFRVGIITSSEAKNTIPTIKGHSGLVNISLSTGLQEVTLNTSVNVLANEYIGLICVSGGTGAWTHRVPRRGATLDGGTFWAAISASALDNTLVGTPLVSGGTGQSWGAVFQYYIEPTD